MRALDSILQQPPTFPSAPVSVAPITAPTGQATAQVTQADLTVVRFDRDGQPPVQGATVKVWAIFPPPATPVTFPPTPQAPTPDPVLVAQGATNGNGRFLFVESTQVAPIPVRYRLVIEPGSSGINFPGTSVEVFFGADTSPLAGICAVDADPLICEISDKQVRTAGQLAILNEQWSGPNTFTVDQAHAFLRNIGPSDPRLTQGSLSWILDTSVGLMDFAIPLGDWNDALREKARVKSIFAEIPFPLIGDQDWFER